MGSKKTEFIKKHGSSSNPQPEKEKVWVPIQTLAKGGNVDHKINEIIERFNDHQVETVKYWDHNEKTLEWLSTVLDNHQLTLFALALKLKITPEQFDLMIANREKFKVFINYLNDRGRERELEKRINEAKKG